MSLEQYNSILSSMLKQKQFLARLREKLKERKRKLCFSCKKFGHLARNYRNIGREEEGKAIPQNKFEVLSSWVMQYGVEKRAACVARPQKAQQEKRLAHSLRRKVQEHSSVWGMPPKGTVLEERGWKTKEMIVTFVKCGGCEYKDTRTEENRGQGFISEKQLRNLWYGRCLEAWK